MTAAQSQQQARRPPAPSPPPGRASWPGDRVNFVGRGAVLSGELVDGTLLMSPHGHGRSSWRPPPPPTPGDEEEAVDVDLTEPRMEAFTQPAAFR